MLETMEKYINTFYLVDHQISLDDGEFGSKEVNDELAIITLEENFSSLAALKDAQHADDLELQKFFYQKVLHFLLMGLVEQGNIPPHGPSCCSQIKTVNSSCNCIF